MPATVQHEGGNIFRVTATGLLRRQELETAQAAVAADVARQGKIRLLVTLENFQGWEKGANWGDLQAYEKIGDAIERIAIVGDEKWREDARMFMLADIRKAPVRYFIPAELKDARAWLAAK